MESRRDDRLFDDPIAQVFVEASDTRVPDGESLGENPDPAVIAMLQWIVARTRFIDDVCTAAVAAGVAQVVILGAGLDARGYRLGWPPRLHLFEVDRADVFSFKDAALAAAGVAPTCTRHTVVADLTGDWDSALRDTGFDDTRPTLWIAEGLLVYLPVDVVEGLLQTVTALSAPGSRFAITLRRVEADSTDHDRNDPLSAVKELWHDSGGFDPVGWLDRHGWRCRVVSPTDVLIDAGRHPPRPVDGLPRLVDAAR